ncbi:MAG: hypothetical protein O3B16_00145 [Chloroflexi bacterium]|nr:hypothetical protein [Chloroflexota bacterium]
MSHFTAEQVHKINHFRSLTIEQCERITRVLEDHEARPGDQLLAEGDFGDTMLLVFQGQVEVTKNMLVRTPTGLVKSRRAIIRLETTDPPPSAAPTTPSKTFVVKVPAFGIGEFAMVLEKAIRTANVNATTPLTYGILNLVDFAKLVEDDGTIGGPVYYEVAKAAVVSLAQASADISNLTQAFFFSLSR